MTFRVKWNKIGSSPRAWGTRSRHTAGLEKRRFIPTGVGNAAPSISSVERPAVHPHGRGERIFPGLDRASPSGSSPRAWGTQRRHFIDGITARFIPTGVGNAIGTRLERMRSPVHPHGRGERSMKAFREHRDRGSSPRAWGTRTARRPRRPNRRFIPTGVGNAPISSVFFFLRAVHPHGRGERMRNRCEKYPAYGSSPRAWGTLADVLLGCP